MAKNVSKLQKNIKARANFSSSDYPELENNLDEIRREIDLSSDKYVSEILISFCRDHAINGVFVFGNMDFTKKVARRELPIRLIEKLFKLNIGNKNFIKDLEIFIETKLKETSI